MARWLPWLVVLGAVAAVVAVALPMLRGPGGPGEAGLAPHADGDQAAEDRARLLRGAGEIARAPLGSTGRFPIRGRVVDAAGAGVEGVEVEATRRESLYLDAPDAALRRRIASVREGLDADADPAARTTSAADGTFALAMAERGSYRVRALARPPLCGAVAWTSAGPEHDTELHLTLLEAAPLEGRVVRADGTGVLAFVEARTWHESGASFEGEARRADPETGRFRIDDLPAGRWRVDVRVPPVLAFEGIEVEVPHDGIWTVTVPEATGVVEGRVTRETGEAVGGADVLVDTRPEGMSGSARALATTDAAGLYRLEEVPAGEITSLQVLAEGLLAHADEPPLAPWSGAAVTPDAPTTLDVVLRAGAVIAGRVARAGTGEGVAGATVHALPPQPTGPVPLGRSAPRTATTGADGRFRIEGVPAGQWLLVATHPEHTLPALQNLRQRSFQVSYQGRTMGTMGTVPPPELLVVVTEGVSRIERDLVLAPGRRVSGVVLDPEGRPCPGASVQAGVAWGGAEHAAVSSMGFMPPADDDRAVSDEDGRFSIRNVPPQEDVVLHARKSPHLSRPGPSLDLSEGDAPEPVTLHLEAGATLAGRVTDGEGAGVGGAMIWAYPQQYVPGAVYASANTRSLPDGSFRLEGAPTGALRVGASGTGSTSGSMAQEMLEGVTAGEVREGLSLKLERGVRITGTLVDPEGKPVAGVNLWARAVEGQRAAYARTDAAGRFTFDGAPAGQVRLSVGSRMPANGRGADALGEPFESPAEGLRFVYERPPTVVLEGRVVDAAGRAVPLCRVTATPPAEAQDAYGMQGAIRADEVVGGAFRRAVAGPGPYRIEISDPRDAAGRPLNLRPHTERLAEKPEGPLVLRLERGETVAGRVLGPDGEGVADVLVEAGTAATWTGADGTFALGGLPAEGRASLQVRAPEGMVAPASTTATAGADDVVIRLEADHPIVGVVLDIEGNPHAGVYVQARWETPAGRGQGSARTDAEGRFTIQGLPRDAVAEITAQTWGGSGSTAPVTRSDVAAGTDDLVLRMGVGVSLSGTVVEADGRPATQLYVRVDPVGDGPGRSAFAQVDAEGRFSLAGLAPGRYRVSLHRSSGGPQPAPQEVMAPASGIRIEIPPSRTLAGRLVGAAPLEGWTVQARLDGVENGPVLSAKTDASGRFVFENAGDGTYTLVARRGGEETRYGRLEGVRGGATDVTLALAEGRSIEGTLEHADGSAVEKGYVMASQEAWSSWATVEDGRFVLKGLPPGRYALRGAAPNAEGAIAGYHDLGEHEAGATGLRLALP